MMGYVDRSANAGVHASTGFEFQKHCALYILLDGYESLKQIKYFICLEHHDDFLICYQTDDEYVISIDAYQAKKSSKEWNQNDLYEILKKMTDVGLKLRKDSIQKHNSYKHNLEFLTNNTIKLHNGKKGKKIGNQKKSQTIDEIENRIKFTDLNDEIVTFISSKVKVLLDKKSDGLTEMSNISMAYIDLPKSYKNQKDSLVGQFNRVFGEKVVDHRAAVETLLLLFRDVENTLNNGNVVKLMDESKRVSSENINKALDIITTKKMAFDFWRKEEKEASRILRISIPDKKNFQNDFLNSIDRFKDIKQVEHQKIFSFVNGCKSEFINFSDENKCIQYLYEKFSKNKNSKLSELSIKAAIFAAYIEVRAELWE